MNEQIEIRDPDPNSITLNLGDQTEWIRISADGFWVRGVKVAADDKEAEAVYNAFKQWLAWAALTQGH